jgi:hypothetical protein
MFRIPDKDGQDVDFILNDEQIEFIENAQGRDIIAKARQLGFSTLVLAIFLARCMAYRNRRCVIVSHDTTATMKLLERIKYMIKHMKGAKPDLKYSTQSFITFAKTDSSIYIGTAGSADFGVGDTITDLHCSEVSRWDNPGPLLSGLFQAVPSTGNITIESTGRGTGNWFHRACMRALSGNSGYKLHFFSWLNRKEYHIFDGSSFEPDLILEEPECIEKYKMRESQLKWRRMKISELDGDLQQFKEQYPCDLDECFQTTGKSFFQKINYHVSDRWRKADPWTSRLDGHPRINSTYAAGVDVAAGVGQDSSCLEIFEMETGEQVLEFASNKIEPDVFAFKCSEILMEFNDAFLDFERNNHGILFAAEIIKHYRTDRINKTLGARQKARIAERKTEIRKLAEWGTYTSEVTKNLMLGRMKKDLRDGDVILHSAELAMECNSFVQKDSGSLGAEEGCHDDRVMASAFAISMFPKASHFMQARERQREAARGRTTGEVFLLDNLLLELEGRYDGGDRFPISTGVEENEDTYD